MATREFGEALTRRRLSRRALLGASARAGVGLGALLLAGCGGEDDEPSPAVVLQGSAATPGAGEAAPLPPLPEEGTPVRGGAFRMAVALDGLDFFDIHRSRLPVTQRLSALQQNRLIRYADINAGALEGDLAEFPEIPDEATYVFALRPGVTWWRRAPTDGRPFTTADVAANIERQIAGIDATGAPDPLFQRQAGYAQTAALEVVDDATMVMRTDGPEARFLGVLAGPWAFFQAPEIWGLFGDALRDDPFKPHHYTGTGPFQMEEFVPAERITLQRNPAFFRPNLPYLERIELRHLPDPAAQAEAYRRGEIDVWSPGDPTALNPLLEEFADQRLSERPLPFAVQLAFSYRGESGTNPYVDRRVAQAVHLAIDRFAVIQATYRGYARLSGPRPWFAFGWAMPEAELAQQPGYRRDKAADIAAARQLIQASGYEGALPLAIADVFEATFPGVSESVGQTLEANLGLAVDRSVLQYSQILERFREGALAATLGWGDPLSDPDPTDDLLRTMHSQGAENFGGFSDPVVDGAIEQMRTTLDRAERQRIYRESVQPALLGGPGWIVNIANGVQRTAVRTGVHYPRFGFGWDAQLFERCWLEGAAAGAADQESAGGG